MIKTQKSQGNTFWVIIAAILALIVLIVTITIFTGQTGDVQDSIQSCTVRGGECVPSGNCSDAGERKIQNDKLCNNEEQVCCVTVNTG